MEKRELTKPYEPNPILGALFKVFFDAIKVEEAWVRSVRQIADRGRVVYVMRSLNLMDFLALDHLTKRFELPRIHFVSDLGLWVWNPSVGRGYRDLFRSLKPTGRLRDTIRQDGSAVLFLKRPPRTRDVGIRARRGREFKEAAQLMQVLFEEQRQSERPILLVPQVFVWTKRPDTRGARSLDLLLGPREWPSTVRTAAQLLKNYAKVELRLGEPLDVGEFLRTSTGRDDSIRVRRATYLLLRRLDRERRAVTGPAEKPPEQVRSEILRSAQLRSTIRDLAGERAADRRALTLKAREMLDALRAAPNQSTLAFLEAFFHRVFQRIYAGIDYEPADIDRLREASKDHTMILLPSHKSHVDYLLLSYFFRREHLPIPMIASGDNLDFFPFGPVMRRAGAFFIRRSFRGDRLYAAVVDAYIRRLIRDGFPIEVFLEGGRSRTGKLLTPKFGLLNMIVSAALAVSHRPTCFVPMSIGYERVVEAGSYEHELRGGEKTKEDAAGLLQTSEVLRHRYGRINLQIGRILALDEVREELGFASDAKLSPARRRSIVSRLGNRVMDEINRVTAVTPASLAALALMRRPHGETTHQELYEDCDRLLGVLRGMGARITPTTARSSGALRPQSLIEAAQLFVDAELVLAQPSGGAPDASRRRRARMVAGLEATYSVPVGKRLALDTSKNIIIHFFVERSLVATAALASQGQPVELERLRTRVQAMSRMFKHEFRFRADAPFEEIFDATVRSMTEAGELAPAGEGLVEPGAGHDGWTGRQWLRVYADLLRNFLEGYRVAARGLSDLLKGPLSEKDLIKRTLAIGVRMFDGGEIQYREAVSKQIIENAVHSLRDEHYVRTNDGKLELSESFRTPATVAAIEGRVTMMLFGEDETP